MPPLYVVQQNAKLRLSNRRLLVEREEETLASLPLAQVSQVVLFGNVSLTTPAIDALLAQNVDVVFLTARGDTSESVNARQGIPPCSPPPTGGGAGGEGPQLLWRRHV